MPTDSTLHTISSAIWASLAYFSPTFRWAWVGLAICFAGLAYDARNKPPPFESSEAQAQTTSIQNSASKRLQDDSQGEKIWTANSARAGICIGITALIALLSFTKAGFPKSDFNWQHHDCTAHSGPIDGSSWKVYATGKNCHTSAELDTIRGAIDEYLRGVGDHVCGVQCLRMTHGGTWTGYVTLAQKGEKLNAFYCGHAHSFGHCVDGGKEDLPEM